MASVEVTNIGLYTLHASVLLGVWGLHALCGSVCTYIFVQYKATDVNVHGPNMLFLVAV